MCSVNIVCILGFCLFVWADRLCSKRYITVLQIILRYKSLQDFLCEYFSATTSHGCKYRECGNCMYYGSVCL